MGPSQPPASGRGVGVTVRVTSLTGGASQIAGYCGGLVAIEPAGMNCPGRSSMSTARFYGKDERVSPRPAQGLVEHSQENGLPGLARPVHDEDRENAARRRAAADARRGRISLATTGEVSGRTGPGSRVVAQKPRDSSIADHGKRLTPARRGQRIGRRASWPSHRRSELAKSVRVQGSVGLPLVRW